MNFVKYKNIPDLLLEADYRPFCQGGIIFNKMTNKNRKFQGQNRGWSQPLDTICKWVSELDNGNGSTDMGDVTWYLYLNWL